MIKKIFALVLFCSLTSMATYGQPPVPKDINALYKQLGGGRVDTGRVKILIDIARYDNNASEKQPGLLDNAMSAAVEANQLSAKLSYTEGIGLSMQVMGQIWCRKKDFKKSGELIKKAIDIFLKNQLYRDAAEAYLNLEELYLSTGGHDYKVMIGYYDHAAPLFHKAGAFDREGATLNMLGDFYQVIGDYITSLDRLNRALIAYKKAGYVYLQATYDLLGIVNMQLSRFSEGLKYGLLAVKTAEAVKDTSLLLCTIYNRVGIIYFLINDVDKSEIYFRKSLAIAQKYNDRRSIRVVTRGLLSALMAQNRSLEALNMLREAQKKYTAADSNSRKHDILYFAYLYTELKDYTKAQRYIDTVLRPDISHKQSLRLEVLDVLTNYFIAAKQYDKAAQYLPEFKLAAKQESEKRREYLADYRNFITDSAQKKYISAINNYQRYYFIKDSLYDIAKTAQLEELKIKYETDQKEKSIAELTKDGLQQKQQIKNADNMRNITFAGSFILLIFVGLQYKSYQTNKHNTQAISKKNQALNQLVTEKEWLLKEIHHRVKNNLQIVMGLLQRQSAYIDNDQALEAIQNSENRMHSIALIHQKLYQSESLDLIGMPEYIDEMISYLKDSCDLDSRIVFEKHVEEIYLDVAQAVPLGLILNEAITNAIKYAYKPNKAGIIYITFIDSGNGNNQLTIADNGPGLPDGFDINKVDSLGINLMRGLSKQLGGSFEIISEQGCTINISFKTEIFNRAITEAENSLT